MTTIRRLALVVAFAAATPLLAAAPAAAQGGGDDNAAVAVNTEDGASVFRLAFSIRQVNNGVVDETNSAYALASCTDCQTVALAFQVVLVRGDADVVVPENTAVAFNDQCVECLTYASATQIVLGVDGPTRFTSEGRQRLAALNRSLRDLEDQVATMTASELHAAVTAAKTELIAILGEELVPAGRPPDDDDDDGEDDDGTTTTSTTTVVDDDGTTTTTEPVTSSTSSTVTTTTSTTSTTVESSTTTTTAP